MKMCVAVCALALGLSALSASDVRAGSGEQGEIVIADFEGADYGGWAATGLAFGRGPAHGRLREQMEVTGYLGEGLVNSFYEGDGSTGTLTSPAFKIERKYISFLIGGGRWPGQTCMNLIVGRKIVRTATGPNDQPGGLERLDWQVWDVAGLIGQTAHIEIIDNHTGGWGHILVDHIVQSNERNAANASREIAVSKRYLNLPVKNGAPKRRMRIVVDDKVVREFEIELAERQADFWAFLDLTPFAGKKATIQVDNLPRYSHGLDLAEQSDEIRGSQDLYKETLRPQVHFTSRRGWNNDSNGLVFYKGEWHLYYQHNPYGVQWGNMHWGHAVSDDLVHWRELPIALYPRQFGDWCFSGSAVADVNDTGGFKTGAEDAIVAAYTSTGRGECIAYSNDRGRTFAEFDGNPVVRHQGRDPKVIWYGPGRRWVMALYDETGGKRAVAFYTSADLKKWEYASAIEGFFECPEIFELPVDGDTANRKWVLHAADGDYMVGTFDGGTFAPQSPKQRYSYGNCFYASQTFNNVPAVDGRRIQIAWGRVEMPGMPFNQMMLFPVELGLRTTQDGVRLVARPVREIEQLYADGRQWKDLNLPMGKNPVPGVEGELFHIRAAFRTAEANKVGFIVRGTRVQYDTAKQELSCLDKTAPLAATDGVLRLELLVDRTSIEIFAGDGLVYMPIAAPALINDVVARSAATRQHPSSIINQTPSHPPNDQSSIINHQSEGVPPDTGKSLQIFAESAPLRLDTLEVHPLHSAWR
jgi:fructan beta-fructosidase